MDVRMPDGTIIKNVPDGMTKADLMARLEGRAAKPSTGEDVAKTLPAAAVRGVTNLIGSPADIWEMVSGGLAKGVGWAGEKSGLADPGFADRLSAVSKPELGRFTPNSENLRSAIAPVTGPLHKPQTLAGKATTGLVEGLLSGPFGRGMAGMGALGGLSSEMAGAATEGTKMEPWARLLAGVTVPMGAQAAKNLKDTPGRMIREATGDITPQQFAEAQQRIEMGRKFGIDLAAPEALGPSSIQQLMADVAASKSGGQVVNQFAANRPQQVRSAVQKGLLDPVAPQNTPDFNMSRAKEAADSVISRAEKFRTEAARPYYLEQKKSDLGGMLLESRIPGLESAAEAAQRKYAELLGMEGQFKTFGAQNSARAANWVPVPGMPRVPGAVSNFPERVKEGAKAAEDAAALIPGARAAKTAAEDAAAAAKAELAAKGYGKVSDGVESIIGNIDAEIAAAGRGSDKAKILTELRGKLAPGGVPLDKPYKLEGVYQETSKRLDVPINAPVQDRVAAGILGEPTGAIKALVEEVAPTIKKGRELYKEISERVINPLTSGPVGRVAGRQGFDPALPQNLNPTSAISNEAIARPEGIRELYTQLGTVDKKAFPGVARTWLENAFDTATQRVQAGENRMVGANFAKAVYGTDQQIANFAETMRGVAVSNGAKNPDAFVKGATNLMEVLQMTGKVPGIGSPTGGRLASNEMAQSSKIAGLMEATSTAPLAPTARRIREWTMQGNYKKLAEVLTDPDAIRKIQELGKYKPDTTTAQALAISILQMNRVTSGGQ